MAVEKDDGEPQGLADQATRAKRFLGEVRQEVKRVTWPDRKETAISTGIIVVLVVLISTYLGLVDWICRAVIGWVL